MTVDLDSAKHVSLTVAANLIPRFFQILGQGVFLEVQVGCNLKDILCNQLGIHSEYLASRIQTIFLNSKPVDAVAEAMPGPGATIALSAAMPGLVGAVMRMGGQYAALRQDISFDPSSECPQAAKGTVRLKLFNLVAAELGPSFLSRGVGLRGEDLRDFIERHTDALAEGCVGAKVNEKEIAFQKILEVDWRGATVLLSVTSTDK